MGCFRNVSKVLVVLLVALLSSAIAQERPEPADLESAFNQHVPSGWTLVELVIEVQENYGTEVEPDIRSRFRAVVETQEDTFEFAGDLTGASLLRPLLKAGEQRTFFGIAKSARQLGNWETQFSLENNPTVDTGFVIDYFPGRRLIVGSDGEAEFRIQLEAEAQAATEASLGARKREEQLLEQERTEELAAVAHSGVLQAQQAKAHHEAELASVTQENALAAALRKEETAEQTARQAELDELLKELPKQLAAELRLQLGSYWSISEIEVNEATLKGRFNEPTFQTAFKAQLTLDEDIYTPRRVEDDVLLLDLSLPAGSQHDLRGIAEARWSGGIWSAALTFENLQGLGNGAPRRQYPPQAVIVGGSEEAAFRKALETQQEELQQRELAEIERRQTLQTAEHEAQRTAAAEAAQLAAMELATRAAEYRALEASMTNHADPAARIAALESALESDDELIVRMAIPIALGSGNSHIVSLALRRTLLDGSGVHLSQAEPVGAVWLTDFRSDSEGVITAEVQGSGGYSRELSCGSLTGRIDNGELGLSSASCKVQLYLLGSSQLEAKVLSRQNKWWTLRGSYPGVHAED